MTQDSSLETLKVGRDWRDWIGMLGPVIGLAFVVVLFEILCRGMKNKPFLTIDNVELMLRLTVVVGTAALGMTLVIIAGGIDLSVGSAIALVVVCIGRVLPVKNLETAAAIDQLASPMQALLAALTGIGAGALCGFVIGSMIIGHVGRVLPIILGIFLLLWMPPQFASPAVGWIAGTVALLLCGGGVALNERFIGRITLVPFIVTLGTWGALRGAAKGAAGNTTIYPEGSWLDNLLLPFNSEHVWLLSPGAWMMLLLAVAVAAMLRYTRFGRHIFAIGSNEQTARLCGVNVEKTKLGIYALAGAFTGLAGLLQFSFLRMSDPMTAQGMELDIIAAVVIGGASLSGGQGSILGTLVGALIMTVVANGCTKLGLENWVQQIVTGVIILIAVALDRLRQRKTRTQ